ncbi:MAG: serine protease [Candidatus Binataceae bacterium]
MRWPVYALLVLAITFLHTGPALGQGASNPGPGLRENLSRTLNDITPEDKQTISNALSQQVEILSKDAQAARRSKGNSADVRAKVQGILDAKQAVTETSAVLQGTAPLPPPSAPEKLQQVDEVIRYITRPIWVVCGGEPWYVTTQVAACMDPGPSVAFAAVVQPKISLVRAAAQATGLMTAYDDDGASLKTRGQLGTAVVVGEKYVVTNRHVIEEGRVGFQTEATGKWSLYPGIAVKIEFPYEYNKCSLPTPTKEVRVRGISYVDPKLDFAILETEPGLPSKVTFGSSDDVDPGDRVVVLGYPTRPPDNAVKTPELIDKAFCAPNGRTPFPAERMAAGQVFREESAPDGYFAHDASTWGGNSGSLVIDLATGTVAGLHSHGMFAPTEGVGYNEAVLGSRISAVIASMSP